MCWRAKFQIIVQMLCDWGFIEIAYALYRWNIDDTPTSGIDKLSKKFQCSLCQTS